MKNAGAEPESESGAGASTGSPRPRRPHPGSALRGRMTASLIRRTGHLGGRLAGVQGEGLLVFRFDNEPVAFTLLKLPLIPASRAITVSQENLDGAISCRMRRITELRRQI